MAQTTTEKGRSESAGLKPRTFLLSTTRKPAIQCTPDGGAVLERFRKNPSQPILGFVLTTGTIISATIQGNKIIDLTVDFSAIHKQPITGSYPDFRLDPEDRMQLKEALSKAAKTEILY